MRSALAAAAQRRAGRARSSSLSTVPPAPDSPDYDRELAAVAASILYCSPEPSSSGRPCYILNAAAFPDSNEVDYDSLLSYVLARLPDEDDLLAGTEYEIIFFAGGPPDNASTEKRQGPGMGWYLQAYHVLSRALRKKLQRLYIVHPRTWVRVLIGIFGTIVSPKFRRKILTCNTLSMLALSVPIDRVLIPPSTYLHDRRLSPDIDVPYASGKRAFGVRHPLPKNLDSGDLRLPRVLRETTSFLLLESNLDTEGLFRIPAHAVTVNVLKEAYDRGQRYIVWKYKKTAFAHDLDQPMRDEVRLEDAYDIHVAASLIKMWYRDLREPIFPALTYRDLRQRFGDYNHIVTLNELDEFFNPKSQKSSVPEINRQILVRHLLPMAYTVASHQARNKMSADNLSICFSVTMVCGPNQVEDVQISSIVRRLLQAAIDSWPELREACSIEAAAFEKALQPPIDARDYEDPLDENRNHVDLDAVAAASEEHRIEMMDNLEPAPLEDLVQLAPALPPRPLQNVTIVQLPKLDLGSQVKRKPAPYVPSVDQSPSEPQRHPIAFDSDGASVHTSSPDSYVTASGTAEPPVIVEKKNSAFLDELNALMAVPKRKAIPGDARPIQTGSSTNSQDDIAPVNSSGDPFVGGTSALPQQAVFTSQVTSSPTTQNGEGEEIFRKPVWPASIARKPANIQSLAKPVNVAYRAPGIPTINHPTPTATAPTLGIPKHRAPSPGLLARMSSMDSINDQGNAPERRASLEPRPMNLRKSSVDDLRRLYEERSITAQSLAQASLVRRGSSTGTGL